MRSSLQILKAWELATKDKPMTLYDDEIENFCAAMKMSCLPAEKVKTIIQDKDILLKDGIISPLDGKTAFHNRRDWANHLKANGCVEVGNDFNKSTEKKREIKGDFDCRNELGKVTHQVMEKYGH